MSVDENIVVIKMNEDDVSCENVIYFAETQMIIQTMTSDFH